MFRTDLWTVATLLIGVSCGIGLCQLLESHVLVIEIASLCGLVGALIKIILDAKTKRVTRAKQVLEKK